MRRQTVRAERSAGHRYFTPPSKYSLNYYPFPVQHLSSAIRDENYVECTLPDSSRIHQASADFRRSWGAILCLSGTRFSVTSSGNRTTFFVTMVWAFVNSISPCSECSTPIPEY